MLALVSFPFLVEPRLTSRLQAFSWSGGYVLFALLCAFAAYISREARAEAAERVAEEVEPGTRPALGELLFWVILATVASVLLVSITTHMSQNVAPIPLLWVLPLALYLATFIFAFESDRIYRRDIRSAAAGFSMFCVHAVRRRWKLQHQVPDSRLCGGVVHLLHAVSWRTGPAEARCHAI